MSGRGSAWQKQQARNLLPYTSTQRLSIGTAEQGTAKEQSLIEDEVLWEQSNPGSDEAEVEVHAPPSRLPVLGSVYPVHRSGSTSGLGSRRSAGMLSVAPTMQSRYKQPIVMSNGVRSEMGFPGQGQPR